MWKYLPLIFFVSPAYAQTVVPNFNSATSTSRSVTTNNLTENIREVRYNSGYTYSVTGPMTENSYGAGIQCSGATLSISPFATTSVAVKRPQDYIFHTPVYNEATDSNGNLTNAGEILYYRENYSGNKDSTSLNFGIAATISVPLDKRFQNACLKSATTQEKIMRQQLSTARLNYELARLKNCHELRVIGAEYSPDSEYFDLCSDIVSKPKMNQVIPHTHKIELNK
jgi:hypothetical protein